MKTSITIKLSKITMNHNVIIPNERFEFFSEALIFDLIAEYISNSMLNFNFRRTYSCNCLF